MKYAISIPNFGDWADPRTTMSLARDAEAAGWDGFFVWDHLRLSATWWVESIDPWRYTWDGTAAGWPSTEPARERIRLGPPG